MFLKRKRISQLFLSMNRFSKVDADIEGVVLQAKKQMYVLDDEDTLQALQPTYKWIYGKPPSETFKDKLYKLTYF